MRVISVRNTTRNIFLAGQVKVATSLLARAVGLLSSSGLHPGEGLYLTPCRSIHTFFMRFPIDVLFVDSDGKVVQQGTYPPWRLSAWHSRSSGALELAQGTISKTGTRVGDTIEMKDLN